MKFYGISKEVNSDLEMLKEVSPDSEKYKTIVENVSKLEEIERRNFESLGEVTSKVGKIFVIIYVAKLLTTFKEEHIFDDKTFSTLTNLLRL